jgi:hypothetical protein
VGDAAIVIFPLTPGLLLVMFDGFNALPAQPHELGIRDVGQLNREIAAGASTYTFERPVRNLAALRELEACGPTARAVAADQMLLPGVIDRDRVRSRNLGSAAASNSSN